MCQKEIYTWNTIYMWHVQITFTCINKGSMSIDMPHTNSLALLMLLGALYTDGGNVTNHNAADCISWVGQ